jgi:hypothetical protein
MSTVTATRAYGKVLYRLCQRCGIDLPTDCRPATKICRDCFDVTRKRVKP